MTLPYERIGLLAGTSGAAPISVATVLLRFRLHPVGRAKSSVVVLLRVLGVSRKPLSHIDDGRLSLRRANLPVAAFLSPHLHFASRRSPASEHRPDARRLNGRHDRIDAREGLCPGSDPRPDNQR